MSKSQIRSGHRDLRERIRFAIEAMEAFEEDSGLAAPGKWWLEDALRLSRELEALSVSTVQAAEACR